MLGKVTLNLVFLNTSRLLLKRGLSVVAKLECPKTGKELGIIYLGKCR